MRIALVGGEPSCIRILSNSFATAANSGFATSLTTNGFLLTRKLIAELEDAGCRSCRSALTG
jgi:Molybdenum cofactor biosynthesis enzyme